MKNIHVLPTDKPSRLSITNNGKLNLGLEIMGSSNTKPQHIYITSDEEIKEGDWFIELDLKGTRSSYIDKPYLCDIGNTGGFILTKNNGNFPFPEHCKKIIITDDQDLIKDGVQAIDDEFLEWFVKNPTCEYIKWNAYPISPNGNLVATDKPYPFVGLISNFRIEYKIIIPQEEPKQEWDIDTCRYFDIEIGCVKDKCICENVTPKEEPKQVTLEEAAEKYADFSNDHVPFSFAKGKFNESTKKDFIEGAKWQAKRMYTKEEVIAIVDKSRVTGLTAEYLLLTEQFKK